MLQQQNNTQPEITTQQQIQCYLCNANGILLHQNLKDYLFSVSGNWSLRKCSNKTCGLVWLNPQPIETEIGKLYQNYYTHSNEANLSPSTPSKSQSFQVWLYDLFASIIQIKRERKQFEQMYLADLKPGKLLDVGCGNGDLLSKFRNLGWNVQGQDTDIKAKEFAEKNYNLTVHLGTLEQIDFVDNTFDAIIINHVIEHILDPIALLSECYRILNPGGILVAVTPNILSTSHQFFGRYWRGLEPPRHLYLFSRFTLKEIATKAGFTNVKTWTTAAHGHYFALSSLELRKYNFSETKNCQHKSISLWLKLQAILFQVWAKIIYLINNASGDECVLKARK
jgi:2-polyprenyl-3-methyl-5-hydroxy-6-metoxy-1,4-benzoquinol methylase